MVIGDGLIARCLQSFAENDEYLIFASGVSNSNESNKEAYLREFNLLKSSYANHPDKIFVYFSTVSVFDPSIQDKEYILHKKKIEEHIANHFHKFLIFRLPNVIGFSNNPHTLMNFFFRKIKANEKVTLLQHAKRYLLDINDVQTIITSILLQKLLPVNYAYNINLYPAISVIDIFRILCEELSLSCPFEIIEGGSEYSINYNELLNLIENKQIPLSFQYISTEEYLKNMIKKYYYGRNL